MTLKTLMMYVDEDTVFDVLDNQSNGFWKWDTGLSYYDVRDKYDGDRKIISIGVDTHFDDAYFDDITARLEICLE